MEKKKNKYALQKTIMLEYNTPKKSRELLLISSKIYKYYRIKMIDIIYKMALLVILFQFSTLLANDYTEEDIQKLVNLYSKENNDTGVLILVHKDGVSKSYEAGYANKDTKKLIHTDDLFEIGSASKLFTAMAIFQLIESKKISLNTSLGELYKTGKIRKLANFKDKNYWDDVTVGMLLNHTSGFIDYLNVYHDDDKAIKIFSDKNKVYNYDTIIDLVLKFGDAKFKPGTQFAYCNTGYVILGNIITKVSKIPWRDYIQKNIFDKAGVKNTYFGTRLPRNLREKMPQGYNKSQPVDMPMALANSAGEIVSTLDDLSKLIKMWKRSDFYKEKETLTIQLSQGYNLMSPYVANLSYGYGLMKIDNYFGHGGQTFGFQSYISINPKTMTTYIVCVNNSQIGSVDLFMDIEGLVYKPFIKK